MHTNRQKKILVSVTNDLLTDQRVHKVCTSLQSFGYEVWLIGRRLPASAGLSSRPYRTMRIRCVFNKTALFYAEFNLRLFVLLLFRKTDAFLSNDLDTLPANYLAAVLRGKKLYYDSHEYYTEVPELVGRPFVKKTWEKLEGMILPKLKKAYTVSGAVADAYEKKYGIRMQVIRNFPRLQEQAAEPDVQLFDPHRRIVLYQGVVNVHRGLEEAIEAMKYVPDAVLYIVGRGDVEEALREQVRSQSLENRVKFLGMVPFERLAAITTKADVGLSLEKAIGLNYTYALPNKLFDYIHAEVPVLATPLPEIIKVMEEYQVGDFIESHDPHHIASKINELLNDAEKREQLKIQLHLAREKFCWENEEKKLRELYAG